MYNNSLVNYSAYGTRKVDLSCGVSYGDDLEKVKRLSVEAVREKVEACDKDKEIEFFFTEFGDSSINFLLRFWIRDYNQPSYLRARSEAIMALKKTFDENDIMIPFPIRTLDFGIKGGETLREMLGKSNGQAGAESFQAGPDKNQQTS